MSTQPHQTRRRGRPPRPGRAQVHTSLPAPLYEILVSDAAANGIPMSDRLTEILAAWYSGREAMQKAS
jgi:hypothetical protein